MPSPPDFRIRAVAVEAGVARIYNEAEWRDTLVVVASGELELESVGGDSFLFGCGSVLSLADLPVRALHSRGSDAALLVAVSRR
jgi:hypothetical protein